MAGDRANPTEIERLPPMTHYVIGLLRRPPVIPPRTQEQAAELQERHLAHLRHLRETGELITTGPVEEEGALRGILVFRTDKVARARELMAEDPLVAGGYLLLDLYTWFSPAGLSLSGGLEATTDLTFEND